mmetsp:Transcript_79552/g.208921  ORF Transcript_79552/g.208921 Transcript_79552/m.208921 type:complete len:266 (+) Transcript_79552:60-857(+)
MQRNRARGGKGPRQRPPVAPPSEFEVSERVRSGHHGSASCLSRFFLGRRRFFSFAHLPLLLNEVKQRLGVHSQLWGLLVRVQLALQSPEFGTLLRMLELVDLLQLFPKFGHALVGPTRALVVHGTLCWLARFGAPAGTGPATRGTGAACAVGRRTIPVGPPLAAVSVILALLGLLGLFAGLPTVRSGRPGWRSSEGRPGRPPPIAEAAKVPLLAALPAGAAGALPARLALPSGLPPLLSRAAVAAGAGGPPRWRRGCRRRLFVIP